MRDPDRSRAILGAPGLSWLVDRLVARLERGEAPTGLLRLATPGADQVDAYVRLFGAYPRGDTLTVHLGRLEQLLIECGATTSIREAVEDVRGPLRNRPAESANTHAAWDLAFAVIADEREAVRLAWSELRRSGIVRRLASQDPQRGWKLLVDASALVARLPADGLPLAELAAQLTGDAHALDLGRPLGTIGLRLAQAVSGYAGEDRRAAWALVGVELDPLSTSVLLLGVHARGDGLAARMLRACCELGEPCRLTLRQLRRDLIEIDDETVFVCENPSVVLAAADRLGRRSRPLLCVEGQPGSAAKLVLAAAGPRVRYHGDFDWPGIRIARDVLALTGGTPWRFDSFGYSAAPKGLELAGATVLAPWDLDLAGAMEACGRGVHEEAVLAELVADLEGTALTPTPTKA